jgi:hypothetical protein
MVGKIFITRTGYDPHLGKHVTDPYLGPCPTLGACRPDVRKQLSRGDHIFVISGRVPVAPQYLPHPRHHVRIRSPQPDPLQKQHAPPPGPPPFISHKIDFVRNQFRLLHHGQRPRIPALP